MRIIGRGKRATEVSAVRQGLTVALGTWASWRRSVVGWVGPQAVTQHPAPRTSGYAVPTRPAVAEHTGEELHQPILHQSVEWTPNTSASIKPLTDFMPNDCLRPGLPYNPTRAGSAAGQSSAVHPPRRRLAPTPAVFRSRHIAACRQQHGAVDLQVVIRAGRESPKAPQPSPTRPCEFKAS